MDADIVRERIQASFDRQDIMKTLGARLTSVGDGVVEIELPSSSRLCQQNGFVHAGVIATIADSAGGYAAMTQMLADEDVLAIEFKINLLKPAVGDSFVACGRVIRSGRTISVCQIDVFAISGASRSPVAVMQQTNYRVSGSR